MSMDDFVKRFEYVVVKVLLFMMVIVVFLSTLELGYILTKDIFSPPILILEIDELLEIFGMFLLVLIGLELFETIQIYHKDRIVRVEVVMMVAIIAVARKVIILDYKSLSSFTLLEVGAAIFFLGLTYLLVKMRRLPFMKPRLESRKGHGADSDVKKPDNAEGKSESLCTR